MNGKILSISSVSVPDPAFNVDDKEVVQWNLLMVMLKKTLMFMYISL